MADILDLLSNVRQRVPKCPELTLRDAYRDAVRDWCGQTRWYVERLAANTVAGEQTYSLGSDPFQEIIDIPRAQINLQTGQGVQGFGMKPSDPTSFDPNQPLGQPYTYAYLPEGNVAFYPIPNAVYAVVLQLALQPTRSTTVIQDALLNKHWPAFDAGCLARVLLLPEPWRDPQEAAYQTKVFTSSINNAKADVAKGYQSGTTMVRKRAFIV